MKAEIRLLTLAGLLLTVSAFFSASSEAQPPFDHDPMIITVTGSDNPIALHSYRHRESGDTLKGMVRRKQRISAPLPLNETALNSLTAITVQVDTPDSPKNKEFTVQLSFYQGFNTDKGVFKSELYPDGLDPDYVISPSAASIVAGFASFSVTFLPPTLDNGTKDHKKIYVVADVMQLVNGVTKSTNQHCFETVTVFDPAMIKPDSFSVATRQFRAREHRRTHRHKARKRP